MDFQKGDLIRIVNVERIRQGKYLWSNDDIVEVKDIEEDEDRIEVWNKDKTLSELIYTQEFKGIEKITRRLPHANPNQTTSRYKQHRHYQ